MQKKWRKSEANPRRLENVPGQFPEDGTRASCGTRTLKSGTRGQVQPLNGTEDRDGGHTGQVGQQEVCEDVEKRIEKALYLGWGKIKIQRLVEEGIAAAKVIIPDIKTGVLPQRHRDRRGCRHGQKHYRPARAIRLLCRVRFDQPEMPGQRLSQPIHFQSGDHTTARPTGNKNGEYYQ